MTFCKLSEQLGDIVIRVLVVEDNELCVAVLKKMLDCSFIDAKYTSRVEDAKILLDKEKFDVIILDLFLPDSQHEDTFKEIKSYDAPVIIYSSLEDIKLAVKLKKLGAFDYCVKPNETRNLLFKILMAYESRKHTVPNSVWEEIKQHLNGV